MKNMLCVGVLVVLLLTQTTEGAGILGSAENFVVIGSSTVTNTGPTIITGNLALWPGTAVTGFPPGSVVNGVMHVTDPVAMQAQLDSVTAYTLLQTMPCLPANDRSGVPMEGGVFLPGVYCYATTASANGVITLDGNNELNPQHVFQIGTDFAFSAISSMVFINGASIKNTYFACGQAADLAGLAQFSGNLLTYAAITLITGAQVDGRLFAQTAVNLDSNIINLAGTETPTSSPSQSPVVAPSASPNQPLSCQRYTRKIGECMAINAHNGNNNCIFNMGRSIIHQKIREATAKKDMKTVRWLKADLVKCRGTAGCQPRPSCQYSCKFLCLDNPLCFWNGRACLSV